MDVTYNTRFLSQQSPCPICQGYDRMTRGQGVRCSGFVCEDSEYVVCTREEFAGSLSPLDTQPPGYKHKLHGRCNCGTTHNPSLSIVVSSKSKKQGRSVVAEYTYRNAEGRVAYQVLRYDDKSFSQRQPDGGKWIYNLKGVARLPYRLPELLKSDVSTLVFIPEGEKDVDNLTKMGLIATTNNGGAGNWDSNLNQYLQGRRVILLPDNDNKGRMHVEKVGRELQGIASSIQVLAFPDLPEKGDVSNWIEAGGTREQFLALVNALSEVPTKQETQPTPGNKIDLCRFSADDAGNGEAMYALYGKQFLYSEAVGWMYYTGTYWEVDKNTSRIVKCAINALRARRHAAVDADKENIIKVTVSDVKRINGAITCFKPHVSIDLETFDREEHLINCKSGIVNMKTGDITAHDSNQRFTYCVPFEYRESDPSTWIDYLQGVVGGGQEMVDYLQLALGYSLTGSTREECLFYVCGPSRSGKGTLSDTFTALLPRPLSTMVDFNSFTAKREGDVSNFDLAELKPSRLIFASESQRNQSLNPAKIKQLTGGDLVRACFKHKSHFSYRPQFKVWMFSNWPVNGDPEDDALWGRVRVITFPNSYLGKEDKTKKETLKSEESLTAIFYWTIQGAIKWYALGASGLHIPAHVAKATKEQRDSIDFVQQWLNESTRNEEGTWTSNEKIMENYKGWCERNSVSAKQARALMQSLQLKGLETNIQKKVKGLNAKGVRGLYLVPPTEENYEKSLFEEGNRKVTGNRGNSENQKVSSRDSIENFSESPVTSVTGYLSVTTEISTENKTVCEVTPENSEPKEVIENTVISESTEPTLDKESLVSVLATDTAMFIRTDQWVRQCGLTKRPYKGVFTFGEFLNNIQKVLRTETVKALSLAWARAEMQEMMTRHP
jgi:putative DNA primase/helicase